MVKSRLIGEVACRQGGHVTREQLRALGMSRRVVERQIGTGRLIVVHRGVYAVGHLPATPLGTAHAALLAAGERSALAGASALALWRAQRAWPQPHELLSARHVRIAGLVVRHSKTLLARDVRVVQGLRVTSPARTALDLAPRHTVRELTRIVDEMRHANGLTLAELRDVAGRNPRHRGRRIIDELIGDSQREPTRSELERAFMRLIKRHGLPRPALNVHVGGERVDAYFPDHRLIVELDGRLTHGHDWRPAFEEDRRRSVDVMLKTGLPTIRFTWSQITRQERETASKLDAILAARQVQPRIAGTM